jgi:UDP-2,3-diacylglucosamine pyrophosphatase LpxH
MCPPDARRRLARLIRRIARGAFSQGGSIELVINGDFLDFLAEEPFQPFTNSASDAAAKLRNAIRHCDDGAPDDEQVFPALRELIHGGHKLTILLGNHDLELSLPVVRRTLVNELTEDRPARVEFLYDGEAYRLGDVVIEHGNRYDGWNAVAHGVLRAHRSSTSRDEEPWPFQAPAGSLLVTTVMNPLKERYRFIDLLKPENTAVLPILAALEPMVAFELAQVVPLWFAKRKTTGSPGRPREEETMIASRTGPAHRAPAQVLAPIRSIESLSGDHLDDLTWIETETVLAAAREMAQQLIDDERETRVPPEESVVASGRPDWLASTLSLWRQRLKRPRVRYRILAKALAASRAAIGSTFELSAKDPPFWTAAERLAQDTRARVVVFGHMVPDDPSRPTAL